MEPSRLPFCAIRPCDARLIWNVGRTPDTLPRSSRVTHDADVFLLALSFSWLRTNAGRSIRLPGAVLISTPAARMSLMRVASGKVVGGRVELEGDLPEGATVTVLARDGDETFEADPEIEKVLLEAIAQCERGDTLPMSQILRELRDRE